MAVEDLGAVGAAGGGGAVGVQGDGPAPLMDDHMVVFVLSPAASYITGAMIPVDGGAISSI